MCLLITLFAAVISTVYWYTHLHTDKGTLRTGILSWMFWGASLMWLVDAVFEYSESGAAFFTPEAADLLNDAYLGFSVVALALVVWVAVLLISDPLENLGKLLLEKKNRTRQE